MDAPRGKNATDDCGGAGSSGGADCSGSGREGTVMQTQANRMTKGERTELLSLIKKREKVMKTMAAERSAEMLAEFESQAAKIYAFNDDAVWAKAKEEAAAAVSAAQAAVAERCAALGIPREFAPSLEMSWHGRGENAFAWRMTELRGAAKSRIAALEAEAVSRIERMGLEAQSQLLAHGIETEAAYAFLASAQTDMVAMMPSLKVLDIEKMIAPTLKRLTAGYH
jgi:hypothetical protein